MGGNQSKRQSNQQQKQPQQMRDDYKYIDYDDQRRTVSLQDGNLLTVQTENQYFYSQNEINKELMDSGRSQSNATDALASYTGTEQSGRKSSLADDDQEMSRSVKTLKSSQAQSTNSSSNNQTQIKQTGSLRHSSLTISSQTSNRQDTTDDSTCMHPFVSSTADASQLNLKKKKNAGKIDIDKRKTKKSFLDANNKKQKLKELLTLENTQQSKDFNHEVQMITNDLKMKRLSKMHTPEELKAISLQSKPQKEKACCSLCSLSYPLQCWRNKIRNILINLKIREGSSGQRQKDSAFIQTDVWKDQLQLHIRDSGSTISDRQWQLKFFEFAKTIDESANRFSRTQTTDLVFRASKNEQILSHDKSLVKMRTLQNKAQEKETGEAILMLGKIFHEKVLFVKTQLNFKQHPLRIVIEKFKRLFVDTNMMLLCKAADQDTELNEATYEQKLDYVQRSILRIINLVVDALITFYSMEDQIKGERDLKRELLINLVTNFVLEGELYFLVYNLTSSTNEISIQKLKKLMNDKAFLENHLHMGKLNIEAQFQFDVNQRNKFTRIGQENLYCTAQPYQMTLQSLMQISKTESPMAKLETIYACCTQKSIEEISLFWKSYDIPAKKLAIDTDQLQGIVIYIVSRLNYPQIKSEISICEFFLPPAVKKSSRYIYFEMISAACSFMLDQEFKDEVQTNKSVRKDSWDHFEFGKSIRGLDSFIDQSGADRNEMMSPLSLGQDQIRMTEMPVLIETGSPLQCRERNSSFDETSPTQLGKKQNLLTTFLANRRQKHEDMSDSFKIEEYENPQIRETILFDQNKVLLEDAIYNQTFQSIVGSPPLDQN